MPAFACTGRRPSKACTAKRGRWRFEGHLGAEVYVRPSPLPVNGDRLLRDAIVYLTCLHESGHALGLSHTAVFADIMYSFQYGGDIEEYFGRYRRKAGNARRHREEFRNVRGGPGAADRDFENN